MSRLLARLRGFHRDRRAQIMPLVFFLGIAFFTGTVLVINTGRTVNHRIEAQNAVDAAAVSGATAIARGMNYISSNNISMAKLLASIAILRAFPGAITDSLTTLDIWLDVVVPAMEAAVAALDATVFGAAAGAALEAAAEVIRVKANIEKEILDPVVKDVVKTIKELWDDEDYDGNEHKSPAIAWVLLKGLAKLGDGLAYISPLIAQYTAKAVYRADLTDASGWSDLWLLPLYPRMPACKGKFADFLDKTKGYAEKWSEPIKIAGWIVLTLSMFPLHYEAHLKSELKRLFTGQTSDTTVDDPDAKKMQDMQKEIDAMRADLKTKEDLLAKYDAQIAAVQAGKDLPYPDDLPHDLPTLQSQRNALQGEIDTLKGKIDAKQQEMTDLSNQVTSKKPPDNTSTDLGDVTGGAAVQDNKEVYPYLIDPTDWPKSYTYFALGWGNIPAPTSQTVFKNPYSKNIVYAAARVVNSVSADLWTPAWHARLVRAQASILPTNPIGKLPSACGEEGESGSSKVPEGDGPPPDGDTDKSMLDTVIGQLSKH